MFFLIINTPACGFDKQCMDMNKYLVHICFYVFQINGDFVCSPCHRPGEQIIKECTDYNATMVVLGTRGLGAVRRTILGSVSDYVVHHAHCPVIVCRQ